MLLDSILMRLTTQFNLQDEQERFAVMVARYERLRSQQREAERQTKMFFQGLLNRSFGSS
jgi:hypothetical protein